MGNDAQNLLRDHPLNAGRCDRHRGGPDGSTAALAAGAGNRVAASWAHRNCFRRGQGARVHRQNEANPARWRGHLDKLLPKRGKLTRGHHAAMPYAEVPAFVAELRERSALAARALEFCILTAARSGEVLAARWDEIDLDAKVWTVPAERTKAAREHRIPLSGSGAQPPAGNGSGAHRRARFPRTNPGRPLSGMAFEMLLRRIGSPYTAHGFRSSFRDWAGNETHFPRELAEHALAHVIGDKAEQAYRRDTALARRRELMDAWARHCEAAPGENVVAFKQLA